MSIPQSGSTAVLTSEIAPVSVQGNLTTETEEPPDARPGVLAGRVQGVRHPHWKDVPNELWEDWRWQRQHAVKTTAQLAQLYPIAATDIPALESLESKYRMAIPPYYFSLIDPNDPLDPIGLQSLPSLLEEVDNAGLQLDDPLEEDKDSPVPGVTHRYPDRALLVTTPVCTMYCRFCTRKRVTMDREGWDAPSRDEERMIEYVRNTPQIRDVIVSGGDPLTLPVAKLKWFITQLAAIEHVDVIRIGTRVPVTLPQRLFDPELIDLLASAGKIWIQTHFNHPREITPEAARACRNLINAGMPINNHAVLLKGVNDSVETMRELVRGLLRIKVRPYYLFHCDPVTGAGHFRTSIWKGIEIIEGLRGHVSGLAVPTYVIDGLHGAGKIPVMPNYMLSASDQAVVLRNYEGMIFRYAPEDKSADEKTSEGKTLQPTDRPLTENVGVSAVLAGQSKPLIPEGNRRIARRRKSQIAEAIIAVEATLAAAGPIPSTLETVRPATSDAGSRPNAAQQVSAEDLPTPSRRATGRLPKNRLAAPAELPTPASSPSNAVKKKTVAPRIDLPEDLKRQLMRRAVPRKSAAVEAPVTDDLSSAPASEADK